jgi:hypothetical protein
MIKIKKLISKYKTTISGKKPWDDVIIFVLNILIAIPLL